MLIAAFFSTMGWGVWWESNKAGSGPKTGNHMRVKEKEVVWLTGAGDDFQK